MEKEIFAIDQLKNKLMELGYHSSVLKTNVKSPYGKMIDLVVYEFNKPKIVFEVKIGLEFPAFFKTNEFRYNPAVRQSQSLSQEMNAPYFAVSDGNTIYWFQIDKEQGRPQLLHNPILPSMQNETNKTIYDEKGQVLNILFNLDDLGRNFYSHRESLTYIGLALFARLTAETNNRELANPLLSSTEQLQVIEAIYSELNMTLDEKIAGFFTAAFSFLASFDLLSINPGKFLDALDEFISIYLNQYHNMIFKSPGWLSELLASLALINNNDNILDIYSNYGDGIASVAKVSKQAKVLSISSTTESFLWDKLKRLILGLNSQDVNQIEDPQNYINQSYKYLGKLNKIFVSPPFGKRANLETGYSQISEDFFLELALDWVLPGGRVIALVPENLLYSVKREDIRKKISERAWIRCIISLEQFLPGTSIKASIIILDKRSLENFGERIMMCKIVDKDIPDSAGSRRSISTSNGIQNILNFYYAHINNELLADEKMIWSIPYEDLEINSWAVNSYDPTKKVKTISRYPTAALQDIAKIKKGSPLTLDPTGKLPVIGPGALRTLAIDPTKFDKTSSEHLPTNPITSKLNDVLIHAVGQNRGQAAVIEIDFVNYFISRNIIVLRSISPQLIPAYLAIVMNSTFVKKQLEEISTGSVIRLISIQRIKDLLIPIPDIETQRQLIEKISNARLKLLELEQEALIVNSELKEQQRNFQIIIENIHLGGGDNA